MSASKWIPSTPTYCPRCKVQKPGHRPAPASCSLRHHDNHLYHCQGVLAYGVDFRQPNASGQYVANQAYASFVFRHFKFLRLVLADSQI